MPLYTTPDGRYTYAIETAGEGDGNSVVYDNVRGVPVWDRWSYEAGLGGASVVPPPPRSSPVVPAPATPTPEPAVGPRLTGRILRVTDASDGEFVNRMYSYWSNAWVHGTKAYVFAGHVDNHPRFFAVDLITGGVDRLGSMIGYTGTGEGWYWDREGQVYVLDGPRLLRISPFTGEQRVVFDISDESQLANCILWQAHSSDDGQTHSATVKRVVSEGAYPAIGTVVLHKGRRDFFPAQGNLDESQVDKSGRWLIIKENDDNRIIDLDTRETRMLRDADGAVGHSDCGDGFVVGEDNIHGACVLWDLRGPLVESRRRELFPTWSMGHVSINGGKCLLSDAMHLSLVALDGAGVVELFQHGMVGGDYDHQVFANLDYTGKVAAYVSNQGGDRFDVFLAVLPA